MHTAPGPRLLQVVPAGFLSSRLRLVGDQGDLSGMDTGLLGLSTFRWQGVLYTIRAEGLFSREFVLLEAGVRAAAAEPDSLFGSAMRFSLRSGRYVLKPRFLTGYDCLREGSVVGSIRQRGIFKRGYAVSLPPNWSFPEQAFVIGVLDLLARSDSSGG